MATTQSSLAEIHHEARSLHGAEPTLFDRTEAALVDGRWSEARGLLDDLARTDNLHLLEGARWYAETFDHPLDPAYLPVIQDRIDLANSAAGRYR